MYRCLRCNQECDLVTEDHGGWEEFWGAPVWHTQLVDVSDCCNDEYEEVDDDENE